MITAKNWETLVKKQAEFDKLIVEKSQTDLKWVSRFNAERLKLALLVEVGEFANEIKSFKAWRKKPKIDWNKAKEELIDCLGYFLGLSQLSKFQFTNYVYSQSFPESEFNDLLLDFFYKSNDLYLQDNFHGTEDSYYKWLVVFNKLCWKLQISEEELLDIYLRKNIINYQRVKEKE